MRDGHVVTDQAPALAPYCDGKHFSGIPCHPCLARLIALALSPQHTPFPLLLRVVPDSIQGQ